MAKLCVSFDAENKVLLPITNDNRVFFDTDENGEEFFYAHFFEGNTIIDKFGNVISLFDYIKNADGLNGFVNNHLDKRLQGNITIINNGEITNTSCEFQKYYGLSSNEIIILVYYNLKLTVMDLTVMSFAEDFNVEILVNLFDNTVFDGKECAVLKVLKDDIIVDKSGNNINFIDYLKNLKTLYNFTTIENDYVIGKQYIKCFDQIVQSDVIYKIVENDDESFNLFLDIQENIV